MSKLTYAESMIGKLKGSILQLETLITGIFKIHCGDGAVSEKHRVYGIFKQILQDFEDYENRQGEYKPKGVNESSGKIGDLNDSLLQSHMSDAQQFTKMKNEARSLI